MTDHFPGTRERIMAAAAEVFGRNGFKAATIRQIAEAAGVNVAAINYHFKGKQGLYAEVLETLLASGFARYPANGGLAPDTPAPLRLEAFVRSFCLRLLSSHGWGGYHGKARLMAKELADPSPALAPAVEKYIRPHKEMLVAIIEELLGPTATAPQAVACALSVVGQCLYYAAAQPLLALLVPEHTDSEADIERLAAHVTAFSLGGIERLRRQRSPDSTLKEQTP